MKLTENPLIQLKNTIHNKMFFWQVIDEMIFVIGGFNGVTTIFNVECYDSRADEW